MHCNARHIFVLLRFFPQQCLPSIDNMDLNELDLNIPGICHRHYGEILSGVTFFQIECKTAYILLFRDIFSVFGCFHYTVFLFLFCKMFISTVGAL